MNNKGIISLSPLLLFVVLYLSASIVADDFYKVPVAIMFIVSSIYAITLLHDIPLSGRIENCQLE